METSVDDYEDGKANSDEPAKSDNFGRKFAARASLAVSNVFDKDAEYAAHNIRPVVAELELLILRNDGGHKGPKAREVLGQVTTLAQASDRNKALLGREGIMAPLLHIFQDSSDTTRLSAAVALRSVALESKNALYITGDSTPTASATANIANPGIVPLLQAIRSDNENVSTREHACYALMAVAQHEEARMKLGTQGAGAALAGCLQKTEPTLVVAALSALRSVALCLSAAEDCVEDSVLRRLMVLSSHSSGPNTSNVHDDPVRHAAVQTLRALVMHQKLHDVIALAIGDEFAKFLVSLLQSGNTTDAGEACHIIRNWAVSKESKQPLCYAGALEALMHLVENAAVSEVSHAPQRAKGPGLGGDNDSQSFSLAFRAVNALRSLALHFFDLKADLSQSGLPQILIRLVQQSTVESHKVSALCLLRIISHDDIVDVDSWLTEGLAKHTIVQLGAEKNRYARISAAGVVRALALRSEPSRAQLVSEGCLKPLVQMLTSRDRDEKIVAAGALRNLAFPSSEKDSISTQLQLQIAKEGTIKLLVSILKEKSGTEPSMRRKTMKAASSLMKGMLGGSSADSGSGESSSASPIRKALTVAEMHEQASGALVNLGACAENRISIVEKGAIPQLVARIKNAGSAAAAMSMISDITEEETATSLRASIESEMKADDTDLIATVTARTQINCARALAVLCLNDSIKTKTAAAGAIPHLIRMLQISGSSGAEASARALRALALNNEANQLEMMREGAIPPLVRMFEQQEALEQEQERRLIEQREQQPLLLTTRESVVGCLRNLALHTECQSVIARAGAIPPLLNTLSGAANAKGASLKAKESAAGALWSLTISEENRTLVLAEGGLEVSPRSISVQSSEKRGVGFLPSFSFHPCFM
jgi:hypothetical protein